jgi:hypothetical protein
LLFLLITDSGLDDRLKKTKQKTKQKPIKDHALPQKGFGIGTPSGVERKRATPSNT